MWWPHYCAAPGLCFPDAHDLVGLGLAILAIVTVVVVKRIEIRLGGGRH